MSRRQFVFLVAMALVASSLLFICPVAAEQPMPFQYAVKILCGPSDGKILAPGQYLTAINIHNPGDDMGFQTKYAIALPEKGAPNPSKFTQLKIGYDQALEIFTCPRDPIIVELMKGSGLVSGFFVIESPKELDVVAVYTVFNEKSSVSSLEMERVPARKR